MKHSYNGKLYSLIFKEEIEKKRNRHWLRLIKRIWMEAYAVALNERGTSLCREGVGGSSSLCRGAWRLNQFVKDSNEIAAQSLASVVQFNEPPGDCLHFFYV